MRRTLPLVIALVAATATSGVTPAAAAPTGLPPIHHVWVIELENKSYTEALTKAPTYLGQTLPALGQVLTAAYATGHASLDNYVAQVSGQAPNLVTQTDCARYMDVVPGTVGPGGQVIGEGCVYPSTVKTIADQLHDAALTWKGYMEDMGNSPSRDHTDAHGDCGHPVFNTADGTQVATSTDQYASRHDPFIYFHSIIDTAQCGNVVPETGLAKDLTSVKTTPNFSWITPNLCDDGHDTGCAGVDVAGKKDGGLVSTNRWLAKYVPLILASPAYQADGMVVITWDESDTSDSASCCGATPGLGSPLPGLTGPGGGHIATLVLSKFTKPGSVNATPYNHYAMLRTFEDVFGLGHLGEAAASGLKPFGADVFDAGVATAVPAPPPTTAPPGSSSSPAPAQAAAPASGELPATGMPLGWPVTAAAAAVLAGVVLVRRMRRV